MKIAENSKNFITKFDCFGDATTLGLRWKRWLTAFELFGDGKGLILISDKDDNRQRRRALLLYLARPDEQNFFSTLPGTGTSADYDEAVKALNKYFVLKVNTAYARHSFRQLTQNAGETVRQFVTKLKQAARDCDYGTDTDNQIRDEVLWKCTSEYVRRKLLEEGQTLTLTRTLEIADQCEKVETQMVAFSSDASVKDTRDYVTRVHNKLVASGRRKNFSQEGKRPERKHATGVVILDTSVEIQTGQLMGRDVENAMHFAMVRKTKHGRS